MKHALVNVLLIFGILSICSSQNDVDPSRTMSDAGSRTPIEDYWCGDTNDDGILTTGDGFNLLNWFGNTGTIPDLRTADINGVGGITTGDAYESLNYFGSWGEGLWCILSAPGCVSC